VSICRCREAATIRSREKNTKTNKITIVKNQKLATQNFLFNMHIHFPFGNIYRLFLLWVSICRCREAATIRSRLWYNDHICKFCFLFCGIYKGVPDVNWWNSIIKQTMLIFHKIIFKNIFHKRKSLYMLLGSTADFVIKKEHLGFLPDLAISKRQRRRVEIWP
jgi:hypothetical protein